MDLNELKPNSYASRSVENKEPKALPDPNTKHVTKPVTKGTVKKKNKILGSLISDDAGMVKDYVIGDVLLPAVKKAISDIITDGIHILLYGDTNRSHDRDRRPSSVSYISYDRFSDRDRYYDYRDRRRDDYRRDQFDPDNVEVATRSEAEEVLDNLGGIIGQYGFARVSDLFELVGITAPYTNNRYGWDTLRGARIERTYKGSYVIIMPKARLID